MADDQPITIDRTTPFDQLPEYLTAGEVAVVLNTSKGLVYGMAARGEIASRKFGRLLRIPRSALNGHGK